MRYKRACRASSNRSATATVNRILSTKAVEIPSVLPTRSSICASQLSIHGFYGNSRPGTADGPRRCNTASHHRARIDGLVLEPNLVVEVRAGSVAALADRAHESTASDLFTLLNLDALEMREARFPAVSVVDDNQAAETSRTSGEDDSAIGCCSNRSPCRRRKVDAPMGRPPTGRPI